MGELISLDDRRRQAADKRLLAGLDSRERRIVLWVLKNYPAHTVAEAIEGCRLDGMWPGSTPGADLGDRICGADGRVQRGRSGLCAFLATGVTSASIPTPAS
jgi:hypothetical protein